MAQGEGFEPPEAFTSTVFKTAAIDHSAIPAIFIILTKILGFVNHSRLSLTICVFMCYNLMREAEFKN